MREHEEGYRDGTVQEAESNRRLERPIRLWYPPDFERQSPFAVDRVVGRAAIRTETVGRCHCSRLRRTAGVKYATRVGKVSDCEALTRPICVHSIDG